MTQALLVVDAAMQRCLLDVLHEDVLVRLCRFLPAQTLLAAGGTCKELRTRTVESVELWKGLCQALLGSTCLLLHVKTWEAHAADKGTASFYQRLFKAAWRCEDCCYDHDLREGFLASIRPAQGQDASSRRAAAADDSSSSRQGSELLNMTGHTSEAIESLVVQIGGMQQRDIGSTNDVMPVTVFNMSSQQVLEPKLTKDSLKPKPRMRHANCQVRADFLPCGAHEKAILVLGGHDSRARDVDVGETRAAMKTLLLLQFTEADGSEVRWSEVPASGTAPVYIYHLACAAFADGRRVCVFGGDIPESDPEFFSIRDRASAKFVYILDVDEQHWSTVRTRGKVPVWRSFHAGVAHTSLRDGHDYFITFGGTDKHCEPFSGGGPCGMQGYKLNLGNFEWQEGGSLAGGFRPMSRMRFGVSRWGRHLLMYGGHSESQMSCADQPVARLDLETLKWGKLKFSNKAPQITSNSCETGAPAGGCVVGGAQMTNRGLRVLSRLVVFRLRDAACEADGRSTTEVGNGLGGDDSEDEQREMVEISIALADGRRATLQLPRRVIDALRAGPAGRLERFLGDLLQREGLAMQSDAEPGERDVSSSSEEEENEDDEQQDAEGAGQS
eukprot:TRINITY_DN81449_c0_g1_i1.p1 TRINITY_DN81449_c0_g1~~TRINITY_DN81449_c0_g1_i1.p1  ORF type:complete len:613 (+),score=106.63 TRINITY_DN81449_c0_g1_i1:215-2053(+)